MRKDSDLTFLPLLIAVPVVVLVVLACYFFIGAIVGTIVLICAVVATLIGLARFIRRNEVG